MTLTADDKVCQWTLEKYNFSTVYLITELLGTKINLLAPNALPKENVLSFQRAALTIRILWGASGGYMGVCFAPWHWSRELGHKACPHPPSIPLLSWQNRITTQCTNNRLQIRGKGERIITLKCRGGNLFLSTRHSRGRPQKHSPAVCACGRVCLRAGSTAMENTIFYLLPTAAPGDPHRSWETPKILADKRGLQEESEF